MLKYMTKKEFIAGIEQERFVVKRITESKFEVYYMSFDEQQNRFGLIWVHNPAKKDGSFRQTGGGYNKALACIEEVARYVDQNAEDKDEGETTCYDLFMRKQRVHDI